MSELERELTTLPQHPRYHAIAVPDGPFSFRMRTNGPAEARSLDQTIATMEASIARLRTKEALDEVRDAIQIYLAASPLPHWGNIFGDEEPPF